MEHVRDDPSFGRVEIAVLPFGKVNRGLVCPEEKPAIFTYTPRARGWYKF